MPEAHAQDRRRLAETSNHGHRDAGLLGPSRSGRNHNVVGLGRGHRVERHRIVAHHLDHGTEFAKVLDQVVGERVVVVDDDDHMATRK